MNVRNIALTASALLIGMVGSFVAVRAQGPLYDKVIVDLPYTVTVRDTVLQPGHYEIRELPSTDKSRVLQIFTNDGMKLETTAMTIPTLDNNTPDSTKVILHHFGNDYYFDKIWIQGKNYGYEFVLPDDVKSREREKMAPVNVTATSESSKTEESAKAATPEPAPEPQAAPAPEAQAAPAPAPAPEPQAAQAQPAPTPEAAPAPAETGSANRETPKEMPKTAANWLTMLLSGGLLSGAGMTLRRWRR